MVRRRLLAQEHASSSIENEPSTNNPPDEINDYVNAISPNEEVPIVHSPVQLPNVVETPQQKRQECNNTGPSSMPPFETLDRITVKCIQVDECALESLEGKLPNQTIHYQTFKIIKQYFELKSDAGKCQLLLSLLKSRCLAVVRKILGIKTVRGSETSNHIIRNFVDSFQKIGQKTRSKDRNAARRVLSESIVSKITRRRRLLKETSNLIKCNVKTLRKYSIRQDSLDTSCQTNMWAFTHRLPRFDMS